MSEDREKKKKTEQERTRNQHRAQQQERAGQRESSKVMREEGENEEEQRGGEWRSKPGMKCRGSHQMTETTQQRKDGEENDQMQMH